MKNPLPVLLRHPEYYLALLALLAGYTPPFTVAPLAMGLACLLLLQALLGYKLSGLIIGTLFLLANLLMLLPLIAEASEFMALDWNVLQLLAVGLLLWAVNLVMGVAMLRKYVKFDEGKPHGEAQAPRVKAG